MLEFGQAALLGGWLLAGTRIWVVGGEAWGRGPSRSSYSVCEVNSTRSSWGTLRRMSLSAVSRERSSRESSVTTWATISRVTCEFASSSEETSTPTE